ncbi:hypothetical protein ACXN5S_02230 [Pseudoroseicyclus sp. H15]
MAVSFRVAALEEAMGGALFVSMGHTWGRPAMPGNNAAALSDDIAAICQQILTIRPRRREAPPMKAALPSFGLAIALAATLAAAPASAACYADYKAKQDNPLRLHYGVAEIRGACTIAAAEDELGPRLQAAGWQLLTVLGLFDDSGLEERRDNAGRFYLRF